MTCPHLTEELALIARMYTHLDSESLTQLARHHQWVCHECGNGYTVPTGLGRDLNEGDKP